jgi:hypothetical protein
MEGFVIVREVHRHDAIRDLKDEEMDLERGLVYPRVPQPFAISKASLS